MTSYTPEMLRGLIPDINHPTLNAMRNNLHDKKIDIPVRLYKDGKQVYAATVFMFGHGHSLYRAALDVVIEQAAGIAWDQAQFHSSKLFAKSEMLDTAEVSLSTYITAYRKIGFAAAMRDVNQNLADMSSLPMPVAKEAFEQNLLRLCAAIISTSIKVTPDPAYAATAKSGLRKLLPKFGGR